MHPNGQIPAYEWAFSDVNPPVHAWSCYRVYEISRTTTGIADVEFLARVFHKLLINFTWWVNRKDPEGEHLFSGGFLGLDNIGLFDRSKPLPIDGRLHQADGTFSSNIFLKTARSFHCTCRYCVDGTVCFINDEYCLGTRERRSCVRRCGVQIF